MEEFEVQFAQICRIQFEDTPLDSVIMELILLTSPSQRTELHDSSSLNEHLQATHIVCCEFLHQRFCCYNEVSLDLQKMTSTQIAKLCSLEMIFSLLYF